jgi:hypothetical protein
MFNSLASIFFVHFHQNMLVLAVEALKVKADGMMFYKNV